MIPAFAERLAPLLRPATLYRAGERLYARGKPTRAMRLLARAALAGHPPAQYRVGHLYLKGEGVPRSIADAERWFHRAAEAGNTEAQSAYAELLWSGTRRDAAGAILWASRAAEDGLPAAHALLGQILVFGPPEARDEARGEASLRAAAASGRADASLGLALLLHRQGHEAASRPFFAQAAAAALPHAIFALGVFAEQDGDPRAAAAHYRTAAEAGHRDAQTRWGRFLMHGNGTEARPSEAETWLRRAALAGDPEAAATLGDHYSRDGDLPANPIEAATWYLRAAEQGHAGAAYRYARGLEAQGDLSEARAWLQRAADKNLPDAQAVLGEMLLHGRGGPADIKAALALFQSAATAGHLGATFALGILYAGVEGIEANPALSHAHLTEAAARGHPAAQAHLAISPTRRAG